MVGRRVTSQILIESASICVAGSISVSRSQGVRTLGRTEEETAWLITVIGSRGVGGWIYIGESDSPRSILDRTAGAALLMTTRLAAGAVKLVGTEPKVMLTRSARKAAMLAGKTTLLQEAIKLHEEPPNTPTWHANCQRLRSGQPTWG